jgi:hypothetical protein
MLLEGAGTGEFQPGWFDSVCCELVLDAAAGQGAGPVEVGD